MKPSELLYEIELARKFTDQLGFLPRPAVEFYAVNGGVFRVRENDDPAGFIVLGWSQREQPYAAAIYQTAIQLDARRVHHALALVNHVTEQARERGCKSIQCWCAADLEANHFWRAAGFTLIQASEGGQRRKRQMILWVKRLCPDADDPALKRIIRKRPGGGRQPKDQDGRSSSLDRPFLIPY